MRLSFFLVCLASVLQAQPVVVGSLKGELGNQCFEIATALAYAWDHNAIPLFPDLKTLQWWKVPVNCEKVFWRLEANAPKQFITHEYWEPHFHFAPIPYHPNVRLCGFFQSEKYFKKYKDKIIDLFAPSESILDYLKQKYAHIIDHPNSVSVHVRAYHADHSYDPKIYSVMGKEYVEKAVRLFSEDALFVVFSDQIDWCKNELKGLMKNAVFIEGESYYHDFYLMSLCKHNIISNSSFSWWAAYLNRHPNKTIVAPKKWFKDSSGLNYKDVIPDDWQVIE